MIKRQILVINKLGLHARAASKLVKCASSFDSEISIRHAEQVADARSIMSIMMLAASQGTELEILVDGADETEAMDTVVELFNSRFGEEE